MMALFGKGGAGLVGARGIGYDIDSSSAYSLPKTC